MKIDNFFANILGAHAPRVLVMAPSPSRTFAVGKPCGQAPQGAREGVCVPQNSRSPQLSALTPFYWTVALQALRSVGTDLDVS